MPTKPEFLYYIPDDRRIMLELIKAIPENWAWTSGQLKLAYGPLSSVCFSFVTVPFAELRDDLLALVGKGYRGNIEVCHSAYKGKMYLSKATVQLELAPWIGTKWPEFGHQPARVRICWRQMVDLKPPHLDGKEFRPAIDQVNSGSWQDVGPIVRACRLLGLRQYSPARSGGYRNPWDPPKEVQAAE